MNFFLLFILIFIAIVIVFGLFKAFLKRIQKCPNCGARNSEQVCMTDVQRVFCCKKCGKFFNKYLF